MKVLEIAMEIAFPPDVLDAAAKLRGFRAARDAAMSTSVGGIGPLLRERIVAQADLKVDVIGVTLLYQSTWVQSWFDWGQLHLEKREVASFLREILHDSKITLSLPLYDGKMVDVRVWHADFGKGRVYYLDAPPITQVVYPSEEDAPEKQPQPAAWGDELRHQQSWLVGRGGLALAKALNFSPDIIILSETPTLFGHPRLVKDEYQKDPFFADAKVIFNDHTPLEYAHPIWSRETLAKLKLDATHYAPPAGTPANGPVDITRLLIGDVEGVFGVAKKHGDVMRAMPSLKDYASKIDYITNGVLKSYWQSPELTAWESLSDQALLARKDAMKNDLLDWVWRHFGLWRTWKEQVAGRPLVLWTRRITGYKRLDLLGAILRDASLQRRFLDTGIVMLIGGRIHQHDDQAQAMVYDLLDRLSMNPELKERIVFLDNFNVWMAPRLFHGADAAVMLADDGREASATGFMKAQMNGGLIIATEDGAIPESVIFQGHEKSGQISNGLQVPYVGPYPTAEGLLNALSGVSQIMKDPTRRAAMVRSAFASQKQVSVERTAEEMVAFYKKINPHP
jgi:starch phosphorylase